MVISRRVSTFIFDTLEPTYRQLTCLGLRSVSSPTQPPPENSCQAGPPTAGPNLPYSPCDYKQLVRESFDACSRLPQVGVDDVAEQLARRTLIHAQLRPGQRVLDIATGTGVLLVQAARAVSPGGSVLGLDLSPGMVEQARRAVREARLANANVAVTVADAEAVDLDPASYDAVLASAALPYMADPAAALARWRRWLRPHGGRLVVNCFKSPYDPECGIFYRLAGEHGLGAAFPDPLAQLGDPGRLRGALERAGFTRVKVAEERLEVGVPAASARSHAEAMWHNSVTAPHHNLERLLAPPPPPPAAPLRGGAGAGGGAPRSAAVGGVGGRAGSAGTRLRAGRPDGAGLLPGAGSGAGAGRAVGGPRHGLGPHNSNTNTSSTPAAGGRATALTAAPPPAPVPTPRPEPGAVAVFKEAFLAAAERSARARLRKGVVRTEVGVLYGVAYVA